VTAHDDIVIGGRGMRARRRSCAGTFEERRYVTVSPKRLAKEEAMRAVTRTEAPVAIEGDGVELRTHELGGGMSTAFVTVPRGADLRPALAGLPDDLCQCPHWGYLLKGRVRMHTGSGAEDYVAGQAFYWAPGHAPEALEDSEYVDFSPTHEFNHVIDHIREQA
jgi:hypothetical protein